MKSLHAITAGFAGAVALTITHQLLHQVLHDAPRMDLMGEEALWKITGGTPLEIPAENLYNTTMAADIAANTLYYSLVGLGNNKNATIRGGLLGLAAGIGGVVLPKHVGLTNEFSDRTLKTSIMTIAIYTLGGLVSGKVSSMLGKRGAEE